MSQDFQKAIFCSTSTQRWMTLCGLQMLELLGKQWWTLHLEEETNTKFCVSLLPFERTMIELGKNMQHACPFAFEGSLEQELRYLNNVCWLFF